jgi:omega-6 fatty acid desaturase (delta-12 desaturase)
MDPRFSDESNYRAIFVAHPNAFSRKAIKKAILIRFRARGGYTSYTSIVGAQFHSRPMQRSESAERNIADVARAFVAHNDVISVAAFFFDWAIYVCAVATAVWADAVWLKLLAAVMAGTAISMLFILGHDAAHKSLISKRPLNATLGRILFLPCLHNYTLWVIQHNRLHHQLTNVRGVNSYSPASLEEFRRMPIWRRVVERLYRSVVGFGAYYLVERWWRDKFFPRKGISRKYRVAAWLDFALLFFWGMSFVLCLYAVGDVTNTPISAVMWGFVIPFLIWNYLMGLTAFLQHTHPLVPWFRTREEARANRSQAELTILVQYPAWYDILSHNIMQHQAHHINPSIPWFRLKTAQRRLAGLLGGNAIIEGMGVKYMIRLTRTCQLYDYDQHGWLSFAGRSTIASGPLDGGSIKLEPSS